MTDHQKPLRFGAVNYLNSKPLIHGFERLAAGAELRCDLPSRLADSLSHGRYDVALIPTFEYFRGEGYQIVSNACVATRGPVWSVKLYLRTAPEHVRTLALDEGSRTSAALCRVLLRRRYGLDPMCEPLPIGASLADANADAVLLIGDRAMLSKETDRDLAEVWDLGEEWRQDTGLPFVFACWVARRGVDPAAVEPLLAAMRDLGQAEAESIAAAEGPRLGLRVERAKEYLRDRLRYVLGPEEIRGLDAFRAACIECGLLEQSAAPSAG